VAAEKKIKYTHRRAAVALAKDYLMANPTATRRQVMQATHISAPTASKARRELIDLGLIQPSLHDPWVTRRTNAQLEEAAIAEAAAAMTDPPASEGPTAAPEGQPAESLGQVDVPAAQENPGPAPPRVVAPAPRRDKSRPRSAGDVLRDTEAEQKALDSMEAGLGDLNADEQRRIAARIARNPLLPPQVRLQAITVKNKLDFETQDRNALGPGVPLTRADALKRGAALVRAWGPDFTRDAITLAFSPEGTPNGSNPQTMDAGQPASSPQDDASEQKSHPEVPAP
jgi:hypothetical protein